MSDEPIIVQVEELPPEEYNFPDVIKPVIGELALYAKRHNLTLRTHIHKCNDAKALAGKRLMCFDLHWNNAVHDCGFELSDDQDEMARKANECKERMYVAHAKLQLDLWRVDLTDANRDQIRDQVERNKAQPALIHGDRISFVNVDWTAELASWLEKRGCKLMAMSNGHARSSVKDGRMMTKMSHIDVVVPPEVCECYGNPNAKDCNHNISFFGPTIIDALRSIIEPNEIMGRYYKHLQSF